jgi:hypothetical protein
MGNARQYAGSSYIKLADLHGKPPLRARIAYAKEEEGKFGKKLVLFFESGAKLSLNATSVGVLIRDVGDDFDTWNGHDVEVYAGEVHTKSGRADAVLVRLIDADTPTPTTPEKALEKPAAKAAARADMDDEIPF